MRFFGAYHERLENDPYYQRQKCSPGNQFSGGIMFLQIFVKVPWWGPHTTMGCPKTAICSNFAIIGLSISDPPTNRLFNFLHDAELRVLASF